MSEQHTMTAKWGVHYQYFPEYDATAKMVHNGEEWEIEEMTPGQKFKVVFVE